LSEMCLRGEKKNRTGSGNAIEDETILCFSVEGGELSLH